MKSVRRHNRKTPFMMLPVLCFFSFLSVSCRMAVSDSSYTKSIDAVDRYTNRGSYETAVRELDRLSQKVYSPFHILGLTRRYISLHELEKAASLLNRAVEQNPHNQEIRAVLTWLYTRQKKYEEAALAGSTLENSPYESVATAVYLHQVHTAQNKYDKSFASLYTKAFTHTGSTQFLQNAAVIHAAAGRYSDALQVLDAVPSSDTEALMLRAYILYDSFKYKDCIDVLGASDTFESLVLQSDCMLQMNDISGASFLWDKIIAVNADYSPAVLVNAAKAAGERENYTLQKQYVEKAAELFPSYEPALVSYGRFALKSFSKREDDAVTNAVRTAGFTSLGMAAQDEKPRINIHDALTKMSYFLENHDSPLLEIERLRLQWLSAGEYDTRHKMNDVWNLLEKNSKDGTPCRPEHVDYALFLLTSDKNYTEARRILDAYIMHTYGSYEKYLLCDVPGWNNAREFEYDPFITAVLSKDYKKAARLYETAFKKQGILFPVTSLVNYASVCRALGQTDKAVELLSSAARRPAASALKSEIHYRLGSLMYETGDDKNGFLNLDYSIQLDSKNTKARLLMKKKAASAR